MKKVAILLLGSAVLTGCVPDDSGDSRASSSYIGAIEAVDVNSNTMTINSMPLSLANARIELNGHYVNSNELAAGMQVDVEYDNGVAYEVDIDPEIVGKVTNVTVDTITVNGQQLKTTKDFTANNFVGKQVMLFGYVAKNDTWLINAAYNVVGIQVDDLYEGKITSVPTLGYFEMGSMKINYSNSSIDFDDRHELKKDAWVEVEGHYDVGTKVFTAYDVDVEDDLDLANAEVEGYITAVNENKTSMTLNGRTKVTITAHTRFFTENIHGHDIVSDNSFLKKDAKVDVDLIYKNGALEATEIELDND